MICHNCANTIGVDRFAFQLAQDTWGICQGCERVMKGKNIHEFLVETLIRQYLSRYEYERRNK